MKIHNTLYYQKYNSIIFRFDTLEEKNIILNLAVKYGFRYGDRITTIVPNNGDERYIRFRLFIDSLKIGDWRSIGDVTSSVDVRYDKRYYVSDLHIVENILKYGVKERVPDYRPRKRR